MIGNNHSPSKFTYSFLAALVVHVVLFVFVKGDFQHIDFLNQLSDATQNLKKPIKIDQLKIVPSSEVEKIRRVGIKNGQKNLERPDLDLRPKGHSSPGLSLDNLGPSKLPSPAIKPVSPQVPSQLSRSILRENNSDSTGHFYFDYKEKKIIPASPEQEILKNEASRSFNAPRNKATERISNFEIRYERPEGVSQDELNSDEKAYYSFYVRSYKNYYSKIYSNYEKIVVERPGLSKLFDRKHLLIGKIDYDENGNIVTVRILKSSENDDLHYFFEETLKQLDQPNPPKVFTRNRKQFSIFYQLQIN